MILVFDVTSRRSFQNLEKWMDEARPKDKKNSFMEAYVRKACHGSYVSLAGASFFFSCKVTILAVQKPQPRRPKKGLLYLKEPTLADGPPLRWLSMRRAASPNSRWWVRRPISPPPAWCKSKLAGTGPRARASHTLRPLLPKAEMLRWSSRRWPAACHERKKVSFCAHAKWSQPEAARFRKLGILFSRAFLESVVDSTNYDACEGPAWPLPSLHRPSKRWSETKRRWFRPFFFSSSSFFPACSERVPCFPPVVVRRSLFGFHEKLFFLKTDIWRQGNGPEGKGRGNGDLGLAILCQSNWASDVEVQCGAQRLKWLICTSVLMSRVLDCTSWTCGDGLRRGQQWFSQEPSQGARSKFFSWKASQQNESTEHRQRNLHSCWTLKNGALS